MDILYDNYLNCEKNTKLDTCEITVIYFFYYARVSNLIHIVTYHYLLIGLLKVFCFLYPLQGSVKTFSVGVYIASVWKIPFLQIECVLICFCFTQLYHVTMK